MQRPNLYETIYAHDRRKHRHRCQRCHKIINAGESVLMYAVSKATRVLHLDCADVMTCDGITYRQLAQLHSDEYARKLGFKVDVTGRQPCSTRNPVAVLEAAADERRCASAHDAEIFAPNPQVILRRTLVTGTDGKGLDEGLPKTDLINVYGAASSNR